MKGIILAGGSGSRLYPLTKVTSKQLLPVYDKPMIYYPLSTLMLAGIRDVLIITTSKDAPRFRGLLGNGSQFGIKLSYAIQEEPNGLAEAFLIGENFINAESCALILGDNIFYGNGFTTLLQEAVIATKEGKASIFGYFVHEPKDFGVVDFDELGNVISLEEKPSEPKSNYAVTGLYFYDHRVVEFAKKLKPSHRGELEITDLNQLYLEADSLKLNLMGRGYAWMDAGTMQSLFEAAEFIRLIELRQDIVISAPEEIAYNYNWISKEDLNEAAKNYDKSMYGEHLKAVAQGRYYSDIKVNL